MDFRYCSDKSKENEIIKNKQERNTAKKMKIMQRGRGVNENPNNEEILI